MTSVLSAALLASLMSASATPASIPAFDVHVTLSPAAAARLAADKEGIVVAAMAMGFRKAPKADEDPEVPLGDQRVEIDGAGTAAIPAQPLNAADLATIEDEPTVLINVYSARRASPDNILDCGIWQDSISKLPADGIAIPCKLIGE